VTAEPGETSDAPRHGTAWVGCACEVIAWNAVRVTRAGLDKQPHDEAAMFDPARPGVAQPDRRHRRAAPRDPTRVTRRLFLVGGSAGSGKSTLAKTLAHELDAGWLQLDSIWLAMKVAAGESTPARDLLDIDRRMRRENEVDDDVLAAHVAASGAVCRALPTVLGLELQAHERLVVDGAWLLPSFVTELELPDTDVRAVYDVQRTQADIDAALIPRRGGLPLAGVRVPAGSRPGCAAPALKGPTSKRSWPPHRRILRLWTRLGAIRGIVMTPSSVDVDLG
jgi:hypothetical protein